MVLFCYLAALNRALLLHPIHFGWKQPLHYACLFNRKPRLFAQHQIFFENKVAGTVDVRLSPPSRQPLLMWMRNAVVPRHPIC